MKFPRGHKAQGMAPDRKSNGSAAELSKNSWLRKPSEKERANICDKRRTQKPSKKTLRPNLNQRSFAILPLPPFRIFRGEGQNGKACN